MVKAKVATLQRLVIPLASGRAKTEWQEVNGGKWENKGEVREVSAPRAPAHIEDL